MEEVVVWISGTVISDHHNADLIVLIHAIEEGDAGVVKKGFAAFLWILDLTKELHDLLCRGVSGTGGGMCSFLCHRKGR